jgi:ATP-dependent Clp protease ATP-binding subunit ClpA
VLKENFVRDNPEFKTKMEEILPFEELHGKDISEFTIYQLEEVLAALKGDKKIKAMLKRYFKYGIENCYIEDIFNPMDIL